MSPPKRSALRRESAWAAGLLTAFAALALGAVWRQNPTFDETYNLAAGTTYLRWDDFRLAPEHPPLLKELAALPLLAARPWPSSAEWAGPDDGSPSLRALHQSWIQAPADETAQWRFAYHWLYGLTPQVYARHPPPAPSTEAALARTDFLNDPDRLFHLARWPTTALAVVLGLLIFAWSRELSGGWGGLLSLALFCFNPLVLAHAPLVTTDVGAAAFIFGAAYLFWRFGRAGRPIDAAGAALCCAAAVLSKHSATLVFPGLALSAALRTASLPRARRAGAAASAAGLLVFCAAAAAAAIWAVYGFRFRAAAGPASEFPWTEGSRLLAWARTWRLLPEAYLYGLAFVGAHAARPAFLLGRHSMDGWWYYFPVAALLKTPLPALALIAAGAFRAVKARRRELLEVLAPGAVYLAVAIGSGMNIGLRHVMPVFPFLFVLAGAALPTAQDRARRLFLISTAASLLSALVVFAPLPRVTAAFPNYLGYFNELARGPAGGGSALSDSNLDWGQGLGALARRLAELGVDEPVNLRYFGTAEPRFYGLRFINLEGGFGFAPGVPLAEARRPGWLAVSATHDQGTYLSERQREEWRRFLSDADARLIDGDGPIRLYRLSR